MIGIGGFESMMSALIVVLSIIVYLALYYTYGKGLEKRL